MMIYYQFRRAWRSYSNPDKDDIVPYYQSAFGIIDIYDIRPNRK